MADAPSKPDGWDKALAEALPAVRVVWDHRKNLWVIEERLPDNGRWVYVAYWARYAHEHPIPQFKELPPTPEPIRKFLHAIDLARMTRAVGTEGEQRLLRQMGENRREFLAGKKRQWLEAQREYGVDLAARGIGVRQTFGFGKSAGDIRSRRWLQKGSQNTRDWANEWAKQSNALPVDRCKQE